MISAVDIYSVTGKTDKRLLGAGTETRQKTIAWVKPA
jgi:hypothetical protein